MDNRFISSPLAEECSHSIPNLSLSHLISRLDRLGVHRPRRAFVQEDSHVAGESNACPERSNTRQAKSRVTDGKHSRNSSRE